MILFYNTETRQWVFCSWRGHRVQRRQRSHVCQEYTYTHRQKLSNRKTCFKHKKNCFVPKYWKFKFYYLHLTSYEQSISATEQMNYVTNVKADIYWRGCFFHCMSLTFRKRVYLNRILRSCEFVGRQPIRIYGESQRGFVSRKEHI